MVILMLWKDGDARSEDFDGESTEKCLDRAREEHETGEWDDIDVFAYYNNGVGRWSTYDRHASREANRFLLAELASLRGN